MEEVLCEMKIVHDKREKQYDSHTFTKTPLQNRSFGSYNIQAIISYLYSLFIEGRLHQFWIVGNCNDIFSKPC